MENNEFAKLRQWICQWKKELEDKMGTGVVPVVGWLQLEATMQNREAWKRDLEAEVEENERERQQLAEQIKNLQEKQEKLAIRSQQLQEKMKKQEELAALEAEIQSIAILSKREEASLSKLTSKLDNPYFMEDLDSDDVSTVFSMFNMDSLFSRFKKNDVDNNLEVTANTAVADLQKGLELEFSEAAELLWKLKLFEKGERGEARHLKNCSICSSSNPGGLLREYGMKEEDRKEIEAKMIGWKGYYFAAVTASSAALEMNLEPAHRQRLTTCWMRIQKAHNWEHQDE